MKFDQVQINQDRYPAGYYMCRARSNDSQADATGRYEVGSVSKINIKHKLREISLVLSTHFYRATILMAVNAPLCTNVQTIGRPTTTSLS